MRWTCFTVQGWAKAGQREGRLHYSCTLASPMINNDELCTLRKETSIQEVTTSKSFVVSSNATKLDCGALPRSDSVSALCDCDIFRKASPPNLLCDVTQKTTSRQMCLGKLCKLRRRDGESGAMRRCEHLNHLRVTALPSFTRKAERVKQAENPEMRCSEAASLLFSLVVI